MIFLRAVGTSAPKFVEGLCELLCLTIGDKVKATSDIYEQINAWLQEELA